MGEQIKYGTSCEKHYSQALEEGYINVDEHSFNTLLHWCIDYSRYLNFYSLDNMPVGNWDNYLSSNETILLLVIQNYNIQKIKDKFEYKIHSNLYDNAKLYDLICHEIYLLAEKINDWYSKLNKNIISIDGGFINEIKKAIDHKLALNLQMLKAFIKLLAKESPHTNLDTYNFDQFQDIWQLDRTQNYYNYAKIWFNNRSEIINFLKNIFDTFYDSATHLKNISQYYLKRNFQEQTHKPDIGLFLSFLKLVDLARLETNKFTRKHFEFYYHQILNIQEKTFVPDKVYLSFQPSLDNQEEVLIPKGTEFIGGKDKKKQDIIFVSENDLLASNLKIKQINTLYLPRNELILPGKKSGIFTNAYKDTIDFNKKLESGKNWSLFGILNHKNDTINEFNYAPIGFAICSPELHLEEGQRSIRFSFKFTHNSYNDFINRLKMLANEVQQSIEELFIKEFQRAFIIRYTSQKGWCCINDYLISEFNGSADLESHSLKITCKLSDTDPAITEYVESIHKNNFHSALPVFKFMMNHNAYFFPYSLFDGLDLIEAGIDIEVRGVKQLHLYNNLGILDPKNEVMPFGAVPRLGSQFIVGNKELAVKAVNDVCLNIEYANVPKNDTGFTGYFENYGYDVGNSSFKATVSILHKGKWIPESEEKGYNVIDLFADKQKAINGSLVSTQEPSDKIEIDEIDITNWKAVRYNDILNDEFIYDRNTNGGFIKLELCEPDEAFGHQEYPNVLAKVSMHNAKHKKQLPLPNPPYTPIISSISLNYKSSSKILTSVNRTKTDNKFDEKLIHIQAFGSHTVYNGQGESGVKLLPHFGYQGNLYFGFEPFKTPRIISLFFKLNNDSTFSMNEEPVAPEWFYLKGNEWFFLKKNELLSDGTNGFQNQGIVKINVPVDIDGKHNIMPDNLFWLRVSVKNNADKVCSVLSIHLNSVQAVRKQTPQNINEHFDPFLPAKSIKKPVKPLEGIKSISQDTCSFGGVAKENDDELHKRTGDRLRHKNRMSVPQDFECKIMERFNNLLSVRCFPHTKYNKPVAPGNIQIIVIPKFNLRNNDYFYTPRLNFNELMQIKQYISKSASIFAKIDVRNPFYEKVQVKCTVKLHKGYTDGYYIDKLDKEISSFITPWDTSKGYQMRIGGIVSSADLLAFIQKQDFVDFVTEFSLLKITHDLDQIYELGDTARKEEQIVANHKISTNSKIEPKYPWSVLIPSDNHLIEVIDEIRTISPEESGISDLELEDSFIIE